MDSWLWAFCAKGIIYYKTTTLQCITKFSKVKIFVVPEKSTKFWETFLTQNIRLYDILLFWCTHNFVLTFSYCPVPISSCWQFRYWIVQWRYSLLTHWRSATIIISGNGVFICLSVRPVLPVLIWSQTTSTLPGHIISKCPNSWYCTMWALTNLMGQKLKGV